MLAWRDLAKSYGRRRLFAGVSGVIAAGETLIVTGRNGSGKSTFLKILAGLTRPDQGEVDLACGRWALGYAAPDLSLYAELSGRENLQFFADARGIDDPDIVGLLAQAGLAKAAGKAVGAYSSGMRQRLRLAFALLHRPSVLLLDEPTLALDTDGVAFVEQILARHIQSGGGAVLATNDPAEANRWDCGKRLALDTSG